MTINAAEESVACELVISNFTSEEVMRCSLTRHKTGHCLPVTDSFVCSTNSDRRKQNNAVPIDNKNCHTNKQPEQKTKRSKSVTKKTLRQNFLQDMIFRAGQ